MAEESIPCDLFAWLAAWVQKEPYWEKVTRHAANGMSEVNSYAKRARQRRISEVKRGEEIHGHNFTCLIVPTAICIAELPPLLHRSKRKRSLIELS